MKPRVLIVLSCVAVGLLVMVLIFRDRSKTHLQEEQERALMAALKRPSRSGTDFALRRNLGTNAIPALTEALQTKPGTLDKAYGWVWSNTPPAMSVHLPKPLDDASAATIRLSASAWLADPQIGNSVDPLIIVKELRDPDWGIRMNALALLNNAVLSKSGPDRLGEEKETILTLALTNAQDPMMPVRMSAVYCLGFFKDSPDRLIPVLSNALHDSFPDVRIRAAMAFYRLDPAQAERAEVFRTASECLNSNGPHGSRRLAADFLKNEGKLPSENQ